jgi:mRNA interferase RelE/StbE
MSYHVVLTATARKERKRLAAGTQQRIDAALKNLIETARPPGATKLTGETNDWRIRVGDYRILYEIDDQASIITVWRIAHRREAYR